MAKAMWMAGLLIGTSTAVTTVIPRDLREGHAQECLVSVIGDVMNCTPAVQIAPAGISIESVAFSPEMPIADMPDAI